MRDDAPDYDEIRQIIIPEGAWVQVERFFNSNGITLGRLPDQLSEGDIPTYILVPTDAALREAAQQIAAEDGLQDEPDPDPWMSPTDIAAELSVSREYAGRLLHKIGRASCRERV